MGAAGGSVDCPGGDATITIPAGVVADASPVTCGQPYQNGLTRGTFVLRGAGDHWDAVSFTDANGNPIKSFSGNITFCFNLAAGEIASAGGAQNLAIQIWNGTNWVTVPVTVSAPTPPSTTTQICTVFNSLPQYPGIGKRAGARRKRPGRQARRGAACLSPACRLDPRRGVAWRRLSEILIVSIIVSRSACSTT
jgi:hypothetical protein